MVSPLVRIFLAAALLLLATQRSEAQSFPPAPPRPQNVDPPTTPPFAFPPGVIPTIPSVPTLQAAPTMIAPIGPMPTPSPQFSLPPGAIPAPLRFPFKIDPKTPLITLLPAPPTTTAKLPGWTNENLAKVPEVTFGDPVSKSLDKMKAMNATAHILAKVNHLNAKKTDGFMLALLENRGDLRGMPFLMGEDCRTGQEQSKAFRELVDVIHHGVIASKGLSNGAPGRVAEVRPDGTRVVMQGDSIWVIMAQIDLIPDQASNFEAGRIAQIDREQLMGAKIGALTQILMPESETLRLGLARYLGTVPHVKATRALANLVLYSPEDAIRAAAIEGLKTRREKDYTDILLQGFRYPLPAVSKRAAEALVKLDRKDLIVNLVEVLERPDPRLPITRKQDGKDVTTVRELVKVNHHRNCVLCHAPGNTENVPEGVLTVAVPLPGEPLPKPSQGGYQSVPPPSPDITVRLDMTYLRQDFSVMMPVADAHPWPEMQRFDFLVRTRVLTSAEAREYEPCCEPEEPGRLSPYHRSALFALRELTGRDTEPTAAAWRKLLKVTTR